MSAVLPIVARRGRHRPRPAPPLPARRQALRRLCRRHAGRGDAGQWRASGRALVQISSPARHSQRRARGAKRSCRAARLRAARAQYARHHDRTLRRSRSPHAEPLAVAALRPAVSVGAVHAADAGRLLLQDLHVAGELLGKSLRAADPPRRRPGSCRRRRGSGSLREGLRLLRCSGHRRRARGALPPR